MYDSKNRVDKARKRNATLQSAIQKKLMRKYNPDLQEIYSKGTAKVKPLDPSTSSNKEDQ